MTKPTVYYTEIPEEFLQSWSAPYMVVESTAPGWVKGDDFDSEDMELTSSEIEFVRKPCK
jgi:hypothetical protein